MTWICRSGQLIVCMLAVSGVMATAQGQLLNSWEGSLEDWDPNCGFCTTNPGHTLSVVSLHATQGTQSLKVEMQSQGYQRWGGRILSGQALQDLITAAANPLINVLQFDVTYDTSFIPQGSVTYMNHQLAFQTNSGWSQVDFNTAAGDQSSGTVNETVTISAPLSRFASINSGTSSADLYAASNGNWGVGQTAAVFVDNLRITQYLPDLDGLNGVDGDDYGIFMANHLRNNIPGTGQQRYALGDLDFDGDNDFNDFLTFEAGYDFVNGVGSFQVFLGSLPEPSGLAAAGVLLLGLLRYRRFRSCVVGLALVAGLAVSSTGQAQLLHSFECGSPSCDGMGLGFGSIPFTHSVSTIGATDGSSSLAITQSADGFNWAAQATYGGGSPNFVAIGNAVNAGIENYALDFDVTYDAASLALDFQYNDVMVALNSNGGWHQYGGLGAIFAAPLPGSPETVHVSISLDQAANPPSGGTGTLPPPNVAGFYQINLALNGQWGLDPSTIYFDNFRLVQVVTPAKLTLEVNRATGEMLIKNPSPSSSFDFSYYRATSSTGSLNLALWNSLDDQNIDAVDGPDPGGTAGDSPLEGWAEAGAVSSSALAEAFLLGSSVRGPGQSYSLGRSYDNALDSRDLVFQYRDATRPNQLTTGDVVYINAPPTPDADFNNDGSMNCADIDRLVAQIVSGANLPGFDLTGDGLVDSSDLAQWRSSAGAVNLGPGRSYLPGDANLSGAVDGSDFNIWNANKFTQVAAWCAGDFNASGAVDGSDFGIWNGNKFTSSDAASAVPEPVGVGVFVLLVLAAGAGRRPLYRKR